MRVPSASVPNLSSPPTSRSPRMVIWVRSGTWSASGFWMPNSALVKYATGIAVVAVAEEPGAELVHAPTG